MGLSVLVELGCYYQNWVWCKKGCLGLVYFHVVVGFWLQLVATRGEFGEL